MQASDTIMPMTPVRSSGFLPKWSIFQRARIVETTFMIPIITWLSRDSLTLKPASAKILGP